MTHLSCAPTQLHVIAEALLAHAQCLFWSRLAVHVLAATPLQLLQPSLRHDTLAILCECKGNKIVYKCVDISMTMHSYGHAYLREKTSGESIAGSAKECETHEHYPKTTGYPLRILFMCMDWPGPAATVHMEA